MSYKRKSTSKVKNAKKNTYKGIEFQSFLERSMYKALDDEGIEELLLIHLIL